MSTKIPSGAAATTNHRLDNIPPNDEIGNLKAALTIFLHSTPPAIDKQELHELLLLVAAFAVISNGMSSSAMIVSQQLPNLVISFLKAIMTPEQIEAITLRAPYNSQPNNKLASRIIKLATTRPDWLGTDCSNWDTDINILQSFIAVKYFDLKSTNNFSTINISFKLLRCFCKNFNMVTIKNIQFNENFPLLPQIDFSAAKLINITFTKQTFQSRLDNTIIQNCQFNECRFDQTVFIGVEIANCTFTSCEFSNFTLDNFHNLNVIVKLLNCTFASCKFENTRFHGVLQKANFTSCSFLKTSFCKSFLQDCTIDASKNLELNLAESTITKTTFSLTDKKILSLILNRAFLGVDVIESISQLSENIQFTQVHCASSCQDIASLPKNIDWETFFKCSGKYNNSPSLTLSGIMPSDVIFALTFINVCLTDFRFTMPIAQIEMTNVILTNVEFKVGLSILQGSKIRTDSYSLVSIIAAECSKCYGLIIEDFPNISLPRALTLTDCTFSLNALEQALTNPLITLINPTLINTSNPLDSTQSSGTSLQMIGSIFGKITLQDLLILYARGYYTFTGVTAILLPPFTVVNTNFGPHRIGTIAPAKPAFTPNDFAKTDFPKKHPIQGINITYELLLKLIEAGITHFDNCSITLENDTNAPPEIINCKFTNCYITGNDNHIIFKFFGPNELSPLIKQIYGENNYLDYDFAVECQSKNVAIPNLRVAISTLKVLDTGNPNLITRMLNPEILEIITFRINLPFILLNNKVNLYRVFTTTHYYSSSIITDIHTNAQFSQQQKISLIAQILAIIPLLAKNLDQPLMHAITISLLDFFFRDDNSTNFYYTMHRQSQITEPISVETKEYSQQIESFIMDFLVAHIIKQFNTEALLFSDTKLLFLLKNFARYKDQEFWEVVINNNGAFNQVLLQALQSSDNEVFALGISLQNDYFKLPLIASTLNRYVTFVNGEEGTLSLSKHPPLLNYNGKSIVPIEFYPQRKETKEVLKRLYSLYDIETRISTFVELASITAPEVFALKLIAQYQALYEEYKQSLALELSSFSIEKQSEHKNKLAFQKTTLMQLSLIIIGSDNYGEPPAPEEITASNNDQKIVIDEVKNRLVTFIAGLKQQLTLATKHVSLPDSQNLRLIAAEMSPTVFIAEREGVCHIVVCDGCYLRAKLYNLPNITIASTPPISWDSVVAFRCNVSDTKTSPNIALQSHDSPLDGLKQITLLYTYYQHEQNNSTLVKLIIHYQLEELQSSFISALMTSNYYIKLVGDDYTRVLNNIFAPFFVAQEPPPRLNNDHINNILLFVGYKDKTDVEKSHFFLVLALIFTKYSSVLGYGNDSPLIIRQYAYALLTYARDLEACSADAAVNDNPTAPPTYNLLLRIKKDDKTYFNDWGNRLLGHSDNCSQILSKEIYKAIEETNIESLTALLNSYYPELWV